MGGSRIGGGGDSRIFIMGCIGVDQPVLDRHQLKSRVLTELPDGGPTSRAGHAPRSLFPLRQDLGQIRDGGLSIPDGQF